MHLRLALPLSFPHFLKARFLARALFRADALGAIATTLVLDVNWPRAHEDLRAALRSRE